MSMRDLFRKVRGGEVPIVGKPEVTKIMTLLFSNGRVLIEPAAPDISTGTMRMIAAEAMAELDRRIMAMIMKTVLEQDNIKPDN